VTDNEDAFGQSFDANHRGHLIDKDGDSVSWYIAGYTPIGGERQNLEDDPDRVLSDSELRRADLLVVHFSGSTGYKTIPGVFDDWDMLWLDIAYFLEYGS